MKTQSAPRLLLAGTWLVAASFSRADIRHWNGSGSSAWSTVGNWDAAPANSLTTDIANFNLATYGGNPAHAPHAGTTSINGISIGVGNGAMTLATTNLSIGGSGISITNGAGALNVSGAVTIGAAQTWTNNDNDAATFGVINHSATAATKLALGGGKFLFTGVNSGIGGININSGTLEIGSAGKLYSSNTGSVTVVTVASGATLRANGWGWDAPGGLGQLWNQRDRLVVNGGTIEYAGNSAGDQQNFTVGTGGATLKTITAGQTWTLTLGAVDPAYNNIINNTGLTLGGAGNGVIRKHIIGTGTNGSLTKTDGGTWTLSGANTYKGATHINGGILALAANGALPTSPVIIGAGTLDAATFDDTTIGTLDVTAATSTINLSTGANLAFAASNLVNWTGGTLNLTGALDFSGTSSSSLRFGTSANALTLDQLSRISAPGVASFTLNASGYLTVASGPPPNPAAVPSPPDLSVDWISNRYYQIISELNSNTNRAKAKILFIGDSITEFWRAEGAAAWNANGFGNVNGPMYALNLGQAGNRTEHVLHRIQPAAEAGAGNLDYADLAPSTIVLLIGINNASLHTNEQIIGGIKADVETLAQREPQATIILVSILPVSSATQNQNKIIPINAAMKAYVEGDTAPAQAAFLDAYPSFVNASGALISSYFKDGIHMTAQGYALYSSLLLPKLASSLVNYTSWADGYGLVGGPDEDEDGDGFNNLHEYALGGIPTNAADTPDSPHFDLVIDGESNWIEYTYAKRSALGNRANYQIQVNPDLSPGFWVDANATVTGIEPIDADFDAITCRIPAGAGRQFVRLKIEPSAPTE